MTTAIIGYTGFIGKYLCDRRHFDFYYNSKNINQLLNDVPDVVYCAAPSGNRLTADRHPGQDLANIQQLISVLEQVNCQRFVLIGTVDSLANAVRPYGKHRLHLENFVKTKFNSHVLRLSSLIDSTIEKNLLYDLKHKTWIENISLTSTNQWYPMSNLLSDIEYVVGNDIPELNCVSEPIENADIVNQFAPELLSQCTGKPTATHYNITPYRFDKSEIFEHIQRYMQ